jgi:hypothetical protein
LCTAQQTNYTNLLSFVFLTKIEALRYRIARSTGGAQRWCTRLFRYHGNVLILCDLLVLFLVTRLVPPSPPNIKQTSAFRGAFLFYPPIYPPIRKVLGNDVSSFGAIFE